MRTLVLLGFAVGLIASPASRGGDDPPAKGGGPAKGPAASALVGIWEGTMLVPPGLDLLLVFRVEGKPGSEAKATLDAPDQGLKGFPVDKLSLEGEDVTMGIQPVGLEFKGKRDKAGETIVGRAKLGPAFYPLTLKKVASATERRRPQMPKAPFPYKVEQVAYPSKAAGVRLAGTLTLPEGKGPFPAVVMITGSGPQDRDETLVGHKPFFVLADALTRRGIAVLRSDDRGYARSSGVFATATTADFADDAEGGLIYLKGRPEIDGKRLGFLGHSEGGVIGPIVAARSPGDVAFLVLMAGTGVTGEALANAQQNSMLRAAGAREADIEAQAELLKALMPIIMNEKESKVIDEKLRAAVEAWMKTQPALTRKVMTEQNIPAAVVERLGSPWLRYFMAIDPRKELARVKCPVLAINGELDSQVAFRENLEGIERALKDAGNARVTTRSFPKLNHLFQTCETGALSEYSRIEETMAPVVIKTIVDWVVEQTSRP